MGVVPAVRNVTRADGLDDWPATPDSRYGQLAGNNEWSGVNIYDGNSLVAHTIKPQLTDEENGEHFLSITSGIPTGWTEHSANVSNSVDAVPGFLRFFGNNTIAEYEYSKQTNVSPADAVTNQYNSWQFGEVQFAQNDWPDDLTWYFGAYADNAGTRDPDVFSRIALNWDSINETFQVRHEVKDGTTQTDGTWFNLVSDLAMHNNLYLRLAIRNNADGRCRAYIGRTGIANVQRKIGETVTSVSPATWGDVHFVISRSRSGATGIQDYLLISGVDVNGFT